MTNYIANCESALATLTLAMKGYGEITQSVLKTGVSFSLEGSREEALIDFASHIAIGDNSKTESCIREILTKRVLTTMDLENIMFHEAVYCGFPVEMNGRTALLGVLEGGGKFWIIAYNSLKNRPR